MYCEHIFWYHEKNLFQWEQVIRSTRDQNRKLCENQLEIPAREKNIREIKEIEKQRQKQEKSFHRRNKNPERKAKSKKKKGTKRLKKT